MCGLIFSPVLLAQNHALLLSKEELTGTHDGFIISYHDALAAPYLTIEFQWMRFCFPEDTRDFNSIYGQHRDSCRGISLSVTDPPTNIFLGRVRQSDCDSPTFVIGFNSEGMLKDSLHHIAIVYDSVNPAVYLNGIDITDRFGVDTGLHLPFLYSKADFRFLTLGNSFFSVDGIIDNFRIWNRSLSQAEVIANMNSDFLRGDEPGLVLNYEMEDTGVGQDLILHNNSPYGDTLNAYPAGYTDCGPVTVDIDRFFEQRSGGLLEEEVRICEGGVLDLDLPCYTEVKWSDGSTDLVWSPSDTGFYSVEAIVGDCDTIRDSFYVRFDGSYQEEQTFMILKGESVTYRGTTYEEAGTYVEEVPSPSGCDSIFTVNILYNGRICPDGKRCGGE